MGKKNKRILTRMSINRKVSVEDASETVKKQIKHVMMQKDAKKRYDDKIDEINSMVGLSQKEREKLLKEAKDKYDNEKQLIKP